MKRELLTFLLRNVIREHFIRIHFLLGKLGLHKGQPPVLFMLWEEDGLTQKEIGENLKLRPATVTVIITKMERAGLVKREPDSRDMRVSRVFLTDKGIKIRQKVEEVYEYFEKDCFDNFNCEEKIWLQHLLNKLWNNLRTVNSENHEDARIGFPK